MGKKYFVELDEYGPTIVEEVDERDVPSIFSTEQFLYATELANHIALNDLKGEILNVIDRLACPCQFIYQTQIGGNTMRRFT